MANHQPPPAVPDELLQCLRRFHDDYFPAVQGQFRSLVLEGQHPNILFIGCSDSRLLPYLLTGTGPGEVFMIRNGGAFVPPHGGYIDAQAATQLVHDYRSHAAYEEKEFLPLSQTILGRNANHMATLGITLHMRHVKPVVGYTQENPGDCQALG